MEVGTDNESAEVDIDAVDREMEVDAMVGVGVVLDMGCSCCWCTGLNIHNLKVNSESMEQESSCGLNAGDDYKLAYSVAFSVAIRRAALLRLPSLLNDHELDNLLRGVVDVAHFASCHGMLMQMLNLVTSGLRSHHD